MDDYAAMLELEREITVAVRRAFTQLFARHPERFYYCTLITTGEGSRPAVAAWSMEALERAVAAGDLPPPGGRGLEWDYAMSPYLDYGAEHFGPMKAAFLHRDHLRSLAMESADDDEVVWGRDHDLRLAAMEGAMRTLDGEGLFGRGEDRSEVVVLVEVMPPDWTNTARAHRLNPLGGPRFDAWLEEVAEPYDGLS